MLKKILLWSLFAAFAAILVIGAINRTNAKSTDAGYTNGGNGHGQAEYVEFSGDHENGTQGYQNRDEDWQAGNGQENGLPLAAQEEHTWQTLTGEVTDVAADLIMVTTESGAEIEIAGRPWRFAQESGFSVQLGDQLELSGFYENDSYEVAAIHDLTSGAGVQIRDETGRPLWAGGRGNGNH
ncbi:MAG: hypothetical protein JXB38_22245 [Anaerolineales bacterium]|nr:hypothetical protein [Anaerolineales bacterium]